MQEKTYNWKRFWCPRDKTIKLSDNGFLYDPDSEFGWIDNKNLVSFENIQSIPCLILLGEPGIGKTTTLINQYNLICSQLKNTSNETLWIDLPSNEGLIYRYLFEDKKFIHWKEGNHILYLFIDSLDEVFLGANNVLKIFSREFSQSLIDRLFIRICCRTADWPNSLEKLLEKLWGMENISVYNLAPLRRIDVETAVKENGLNTDNFMREIFEKEVVSLANRPITLQMLLNVYEKHFEFPSTRTELYDKGCRLLCEETNLSRHETKLSGNYTGKQKFAIAKRIATLTIFSNRFAVFTGLDEGNVPKEDIHYQKISGGFEAVNGDIIEVSEEAVKETLGTGLFSSRGSQRMGWSHQTYAEFLAAKYLIENKITTEKILSLLIHPDDRERKLIPQLNEVSSWLAGMNKDIFKYFIEVNPEILLNADYRKINSNERKELVSVYLKLFKKNKLSHDIEMTLQYYKLNHPDLGEQLKPYICDKSLNYNVRYEAIDIAEFCNVKELQDCLLSVCLDHEDDYNIRVSATSALSNIGDDDIKLKLKPLAFGQAGEDPDDCLKGYALKSLWPKHLSIEEMFNLLTPYKKNNLSGGYKSFIYNIPRKINIVDLPIAFYWIENTDIDLICAYFDHLVEKILEKSWDNLDNEKIFENFLALIYYFLKNSDKILGTVILHKINKLIESDQNKRQKIIIRLVPLLAKDEKSLQELFLFEFQLIRNEDFSWVIQNFEKSPNRYKKIWTEFAHLCFNDQNQEDFEILYSACEKSSFLKKYFKYKFGPISLNSEHAENWRNRLAKRKKRHNEEMGHQLSFKEKMESLLNEFENGNIDSWYELTSKLIFTKYRTMVFSDLISLDVWVNFSENFRKRILNAAKIYLNKWEPEFDKWLGLNRTHVPDFAGYVALRLIFTLDEEYLLSLKRKICRKWAPVILGFPYNRDFDKENVQRDLVKIVYNNASNEVIKTLLLLIDRENLDNDFKKIDQCFDNRIKIALLKKVKEENLNPEGIGNILEYLIDKGISGAIKYAENLVKNHTKYEGDLYEKSVIAACKLIFHSENAGWRIVWLEIKKDTTFGKDIINKIVKVYMIDYTSFLKKLNENQLAELYIWMETQYPLKDDPKFENAHFVGPRESIGELRGNILTVLKNRGTKKASVSIGKICKALPNQKWIYRVLLESQEITRKETWIPPNPEEILSLIKNSDKRIVQNGDQLLEVIIQSLKRMEEKLHGETPSVNFLWEKSDKNKFKPKDENDLSDFIKIHLDEDLKSKGIILNREVEIKKSFGKGSGQRTDLKVDAVINDDFGNIVNSITAIIEVKGCWNDELMTAMEPQLKNRYMKNKYSFGLYLVGWFNCEKWDGGDSRKKKAEKLNLSEVKEELEQQAINLSNSDCLIKVFILDTSLN